ncbi:MAG: hypothetical protein B7Z78_13550 [Rhodospirillales bacterium 20-60-12]|nr:MAG: hypothetical protein B7Z78_13550 [Rhodospirillales bacterium 20-60-12]HQT67186.1 rhodanese-like domain-containing protein [Acetobacteraceae bacterium]
MSVLAWLKGKLSSAEPGKQLLPITQSELRIWMKDRGVVLVDIREPEEHRRFALPGSLSMPLSRYPEKLPSKKSAEKIVFYCQSGMRTRMNAARLAASTDLPSFMLVAGLRGWSD